MKATFFKGVVLGAVVSSAMVISTVAFAGSGIGGVFNLGKTNTVNASTVLQGSVNGSELNVRNNSTAQQATGLVIHTEAGKSPLVVNSSAQVQNLNASLLHGVPASGFIQGTGSVSGNDIKLAAGASADIGSLAGLGTMVAECATNGYTHAGLKYTTTQTESLFMSTVFPAAITDTTNTAPSPSFVSSGDGSLDVATIRVVQLTKIATATVTWTASPTACDFNAQVVESQ